MPSRLDLQGQKFGMLTVLEFSHVNNRGHSYWKCQCECGSIKELEGYRIKSGVTSSCGCLSKLPKGEAMFNHLFKNYRNGAKSRGISFNLDKAKFKELTKQNCFYCGTVPKTEFKTKTGNGTYVYNGIDRVDNLKGYEEGNVVACCSICNKAKHIAKYEDFIEWIKTVYLNLKGKNLYVRR